MNLNFNFVFSKSMNLNFKIRKKMSGSNPSYGVIAENIDIGAGGHGSIPGQIKPYRVSPTARYRCDVSSEKRCRSRVDGPTTHHKLGRNTASITEI